jgi:hypothetical protein
MQSQSDAQAVVYAGFLCVQGCVQQQNRAQLAAAGQYVPTSCGWILYTLPATVYLVEGGGDGQPCLSFMCCMSCAMPTDVALDG